MLDISSNKDLAESDSIYHLGLSIRNHESLTKLNVSNSLPYFSDVFFRGISGNNNIRILNISGSIKDESISYLVEFLAANNNLEKLDISDNLLSADYIEGILDALKYDKKSLAHLNISRIVSGDLDTAAHGYLMDKIFTGLAKIPFLLNLEMEGNNLGFLGAIKLYKYIPNSSITSLDLRNNKLSRKGAFEVLNLALNKSKSLLKLRLSERYNPSVDRGRVVFNWCYSVIIFLPLLLLPEDNGDLAVLPRDIKKLFLEIVILLESRKYYSLANIWN